MTDFLKIAKSIAVHFAHICAYGVETVKGAVQNGEVMVTKSFKNFQTNNLLIIYLI